MNHSDTEMKSMILAAGFGTRFRPITYTLPKPLVPLCNRPLIAYAVDNFLQAGVDEIIVNLHHLPEPLETYLSREFLHRCRFHFSREEQILGTGGGIRRVRELLAGQEEFYLVNGDTIQFPPYAELSRVRMERDAAAALTLRHPPHGDKFTAVWFDDGRITGFGAGTGVPLMFSGSHAISTRVFEAMPDEEVFGIVEAVYRPLIRSGETIAGVIDDGLWFDIGTPQRYLSATSEVRELMTRRELDAPAGSRVAGTSLVHDSARASGDISRSVIGARSVVEGTITDTSVWEDCRIAPGVKLTSCIVAHGTAIDQPMELANAMICPDDRAIPRDAGCEFRNGLAIATF